MCLNLIFLFTSDLWKSPGETSAAGCAEVGPVGFTGNETQSIYWSKRPDNISVIWFSVNKEPGEQRKDSGVGCCIFDVQLFDHSNLDKNSKIISEDQTVPSRETESDESNVHPSDAPLLSCDPDKSSQRSRLESQIKQSRTCTKVNGFI